MTETVVGQRGDFGSMSYEYADYLAGAEVEGFNCAVGVANGDVAFVW